MLDFFASRPLYQTTGELSRNRPKPYRAGAESLENLSRPALCTYCFLSYVIAKLWAVLSLNFELIQLHE
jgi:hypothetical protein